MSDVPPRPRIRPATSDDWDPSDRSVRRRQTGPRGHEQPANAADAEFDTSTYYEYIERHTGDLPVSRTRRSNVFAANGTSPFDDRIGGATSGSGVTARSDARRGGDRGSGYQGYPGQSGGSRSGSDTGGFGAPGYGPSGAHSGIVPAAVEVGRRKSTGVKVTVVILAILMVLALVGFLGISWLAPDTGTVPVDVSTDASAPADPTPSEQLVQPSGTPEEELDGFVQSSAATAAGLEGRWVTQVSAKKVGLEADGQTWTAQSILDEFTANQVKYPGSILIYSGDWGSYTVSDYWVTVVDTPYDDPESALAQCRSWGLDRDHCLAKRLVKDGSAEDNSAYLDG